MRAGALDSFVTVQTKTNTRDAMGGAIAAWTTFAEVWAEIRPASGRERFINAQLLPEATYKCRMRYLEGVRPSMRIWFDGEVYEILYVSHDSKRRETMLDLKTGVRND